MTELWCNLYFHLQTIDIYRLLCLTTFNFSLEGSAFLCIYNAQYIGIDCLFSTLLQSTLKPCKSEPGKPISRRGDLNCKFVDMCFFPKIYLIFQMPIFDQKEISNRGISLLQKSLNCTFLTCFSISLKIDCWKENNRGLPCYIVSKLVHFLTKRSI